MKRFLSISTIIMLMCGINAFAVYSNQPLRLAYDSVSQKYCVIMQNGTGLLQNLNQLNSDEGILVNTILDAAGSETQYTNSFVSSAGSSYSDNLTDFRRVTCNGRDNMNFTALAMDKLTGNLFFIDNNNNSIIKVNKGAADGEELNIFPKEAESAVDLVCKDSYLYILMELPDSGATKIYKYNLNTSSIDVIFNSKQYSGASGITAGTDGNLYVSYFGNGENAGTILRVNSAGNNDFSVFASGVDTPSSIEYIADQNAIAFVEQNRQLIGYKLLGAPAAPAIIYPTNNAELNSYIVDFSWCKVMGENINYDFFLARDSAFTDTVSCYEYAKTTLPQITLAASTEYWWKVRAKSAGAIGGWSRTMHFTTGAVSYAAPVLVSPASNAKSQPAHPTFIWKKSNGVYYELQISKANNFGTFVEYSTYLQDTSYICKNPLEAGTHYYWRVRTFATQDNMSAWSEIRSFYTDNTNPTAPQLYKPLNFSVNNPRETHLLWKAVDFTDYYTVQASKYITFTDSLILNKQVAENTFGGIYDTVLTPKLELGQLYYWRVAAANINGTGSWSEIWAFSVIIADSSSGGGDTSLVASKVVTLPIYPQPADNFCVINTNELGLSGNAEIDVYSGDGRKLLTINNLIIPSDGRLEIPLSELSAGTYFLRIGNGKSSYAGKFIKN